jgi:hypothetical protein
MIAKIHKAHVRTRSISPILLAISFLLCVANAPAAEPPLVDLFSDRQTSLSVGAFVDANNAAATSEVGEPRHAGKNGGHSLWISWVAPEDGIATFQTDGSDFDTLLGVYTLSTGDTTVDRLHEVTSNDDASNTNATSFVQFGALAGQRYEIAVDGFAGAVGNIHLSWSFIPVSDPPPIIVSVPNDQSARQGDPVTLTVDMTVSKHVKLNWRFNGNDLGVEGPTVFIPSLQPENLGIYSLRITVNGVRFETRPIELQINSEGQTNALARDKLLQAFDSRVHSDDDPIAPQRLLIVPKKPGLTAQSAAVTAAATGVARGYNGSQIFDTTFATSDPQEPLHCAVSRTATYWLAYEAPTNGVVTLDTVGSAYDTVLAVYSYSAPLTSYAQLVPVDCDTGSAGNGASRVVFNVQTKAQYAFVVAAATAAHSIAHLNYALTPKTAPTQPVLNLQSPGALPTTNGAFIVTFYGEPGIRYILESCDSFTNWIPQRMILVGAGAPLSFTNTFTANVAAFFRFRAE